MVHNSILSACTECGLCAQRSVWCCAESVGSKKHSRYLQEAYQVGSAKSPTENNESHLMRMERHRAGKMAQ